MGFFGWPIRGGLIGREIRYINVHFHNNFDDKLICCYSRGREILQRKLNCAKMKNISEKTSITDISQASYTFIRK